MMIQIVGTQILNAITNYQKSSLDLHTKITSCSRIFKYQPAVDAASASCFLALFSMIMTRSKTKAQSAPAFTVTVWGSPKVPAFNCYLQKTPQDSMMMMLQIPHKKLCMYVQNDENYS
jgi:hypothetical protein